MDDLIPEGSVLESLEKFWPLLILELCLVVIAVRSGVQAIKAVGRHYLVKPKDKDPWWWQTAFRAFPLLIGLSVGFFFPVPSPWGWSVGFVAGGLNVILYKRITRYATVLEPFPIASAPQDSSDNSSDENLEG
jgi:hypothetical protein